MTSRLSLPPRARTRCWTTWEERGVEEVLRAYDRYTVALRAALVAYGAQQYFVRLLVVPADRHAPGSPDRVRESRRGVAPTRPSARRSAHSPPAFLPRASQGWDDAPSAIPKEVPVPKAEKAAPRRRAPSDDEDRDGEAGYDRGRRLRPRRRFEPTVRRVRYDRLGDVYIRRDAASNPRASSSSSSSSSPHAQAGVMVGATDVHRLGVRRERDGVRAWASPRP